MPEVVGLALSETCRLKSVVCWGPLKFTSCKFIGQIRQPFRSGLGRLPIFKIAHLVNSAYEYGCNAYFCILY